LKGCFLCFLFLCPHYLSTEPLFYEKSPIELGGLIGDFFVLFLNWGFKKRRVIIFSWRSRGARR
ncbi:MAG: hypothetical protein SOW33_03145, partial [Sodaliphilus sp.]|nr:hypothetical protein [Sodaliphilus sp.]